MTLTIMIISLQSSLRSDVHSSPFRTTSHGIITCTFLSHCWFSALDSQVKLNSDSFCLWGHQKHEPRWVEYKGTDRWCSFSAPLVEVNSVAWKHCECWGWVSALDELEQHLVVYGWQPYRISTTDMFTRTIFMTIFKFWSIFLHWQSGLGIVSRKDLY